MAVVVRAPSAPLPDHFLEVPRGQVNQLKPPEVCPICCDTVVELIHPSDYCNTSGTSCSCTHATCKKCLATWIDGQLPSCRAQKQLRIRCVACDKFLPQKLVLERSQAANMLAEELDKRFQLQCNRLYSPDAHVDCIDPTCVGIGYLQYNKIMCFVCHTQWETEGGAAPAEDSLPEGVKRCPGCTVLIEKNGGCDHMICGLCKHEFRWTTLASYR